jgi:hypothetical protein
MSGIGFTGFNFDANARLVGLDAAVKTYFRKQLTAAEVDYRSKSETEKRPTIDILCDMDGGGTNGNMEYVLPTLEADLKDIADGTIPEYTPEAASIRSEATPNGVIVSIYEYQLDDDQYGILRKGLDMLAGKVARWSWKNIGKSLYQGLTTKTVDGLSYFNAAHYTNLKDTSAGTFRNLVTLPLTDNNFAAVYEEFADIPQEDGEAVADNYPNILVVSNRQANLAQKIVYEMTLFGGASNPNCGKAKVVVVPELGRVAPNFWALFKTDAFGVKPLIWNQRMAPRITPIEPRTTAKGRQYRWLVDARASLAFYEPRLGFASNP